MALFVVQNNHSGLTLKNGRDLMVVEADDAANAAAMASAYHDGDASWANATVTAFTSATDLSPITDGDGNTAAFSLFVSVKGATVNNSFEVAAAASDDLDALGTAIVSLINADDNIANASYSTPTLTVATGSGGDDLGDHSVVCELRLNGVALPGFVGSITHEGVSTAALTVALVPGEGVPSVLATGRAS